jgi:hypothetical protein
MLFAYNEDGTLEVVADEAEARQHFEAFDVEGGAIRLFDEAGRPLSPVFLQRAERTVLGMRVSDDPGPFTLRPSSEPGAETLRDAFGPSVVLMPNRWFKDLDAVNAHLDG